MYGGRVFGRGEPSASKPAPAGQQACSAGELKAGDKVEHKIFGPGTVLAVDGDRLTVRFAKSGQTKKLLAGYAPLVKISG